MAVERDERCLPALQQVAERYSGRLEMHLGEALQADWRALLGTGPLAEQVLIVANLPYSVATMLLIGRLETEPWPPWYERMVLMFQRAVAERIVAAPGTKPYGRLAVIAQWRTRPRVVMSLKPEAFTPPPKVASAVVELIPRPHPDPPCPAKILGEVTAAAFGQRRKMLRTSLKPLTPMPELLLRGGAVAGAAGGAADGGGVCAVGGDCGEV